MGFVKPGQGLQVQEKHYAETRVQIVGLPIHTKPTEIRLYRRRIGAHSQIDMVYSFPKFCRQSGHALLTRSAAVMQTKSKTCPQLHSIVKHFGQSIFVKHMEH